MNRYIIITTLLLLLDSCNTRESKEEYPPITDRFIRSEERSCETIFATKYDSVDELLKDFHANAKYKDSLELNLRLGTYFHHKENYDSALHYYKQAEKIDTSEPELFYNMALAYSEKSEFEIALRQVEKALDICGDRWDILNSKCYILGKLDRCDEAIMAGLISKRINSDNKKIYGNLLRCFDKLNQADSVKNYIRQIDNRFNETADWIDDLRKKYD